jgi:hypothetical protein
VNQRVHLCIRGCLTLKLSGSWKTVICSSPLGVDLDRFVLPPSGEIGMVERSTGDDGFAKAEAMILEVGFLVQ